MDLIHYLNDVIEKFESALLCYGQGTDNSYDEAIYLVYGGLGIDYQKELSETNRELAEPEIQYLNDLVNKRIEQHRPVAYLLNEAWFAQLKFYCDERALIPRSPIAELILNNFQTLLTKQPRRVLDLCCGGGCIGIATAKHNPGSEVELADIDEQALALAESNIQLYGLESRVRTVQSDLFSNIDKEYDLILCNPPYVSQQEYDSMPAEFKAEPALGLISAEEGMALPAKVLREAAAHLGEDGLLIMEVGYSAEALLARFSTVPFLWLEFANGGEGVFAISRQQLEQYSEEFN